MYRSILREPTAEERARLRSGRRAGNKLGKGCFFLIVSLGIVGVAMAAISAATLGGELAMHLGGRESLATGLVAGGALALAVIAFSCWRVWRDHSQVAPKPEPKPERIEELQVSAQRIVMLVPDEETSFWATLGFDLGDGKVLLLHGLTLLDPRIYGGKRSEAHEPGRFNHLPGALGFPCSDFVVLRSEASGQVLGIRPGSEYVEPERRVWSGARNVDRPELELLDGNLDELPDWEPPPDPEIPLSA